MGKKIMFVIVNYPDWRQDFYHQHMMPRNKEFCAKYNYEYLEFNGGEPYFRGHPTWWKFSKVRDWVNDGTFAMGDTIMHIDADMALVDGRSDMPCNKSFTYAIDSCNTHCMGLYALKLNYWSVNMLDWILCDKRYDKFKDFKTTGSMGEHSAFWEIFREQASWYSLAGIKRHSQDSFFLLNNWGWHSNHDFDTVYSIQELHRRVEILPPCWNVTHLPDEDGWNQFYINPTDASETIVRHFAAGRNWREDYFKEPLKGARLANIQC